MKKYIGFMVFASLFLSLGLISTVRAESEDKVETADQKIDDAKEAFKLEREAKKEEMKQQRDENKEEFKQEREALKEQIKNEKETIGAKSKEEREALHEQLKAEREVLREKIKTEREVFTEKLKSEREAFMADLKTKKEAWKSTRSEKKLEFCEKAKETFSNKFTEAISKLGEFQTRVTGVVEKIKAEGKDTAAAESALALSKTKLAEAKTKLASTADVVPESSCENMTGEVFEQIKLQAREAKDLLKESKNYLHDSIKELKTLRGLADEPENESEDESVDDNGVDATTTN